MRRPEEKGGVRRTRRKTRTGQRKDVMDTMAVIRSALSNTR